jgi:hypothetical protein
VERKPDVNTATSAAVAAPSTNAPKIRYKSVPENYRALSESKYHRVIGNLEAVLLEISTDGIGLNTPDGNISSATLTSWAEHLRDALETLSKGH